MIATHLRWTGPEPDPKTGRPVWQVCAAARDRTPVGTVYRVRDNFALAALLARRMSRQRRLFLVAEARHKLGPGGKTCQQIDEELRRHDAGGPAMPGDIYRTPVT